MTKREADTIVRILERNGVTVEGIRHYFGVWVVDYTVGGAVETIFNQNDFDNWCWDHGYKTADDAIKNNKPTGRPTINGVAMVKHNVHLTPEQWEWVERQGTNRSDGLRNIVQQAMSEWHSRKG